MSPCFVYWIKQTPFVAKKLNKAKSEFLQKKNTCVIAAAAFGGVVLHDSPSPRTHNPQTRRNPAANQRVAFDRVLSATSRDSSPHTWPIGGAQLVRVPQRLEPSRPVVLTSYPLSFPLHFSISPRARQRRREARAAARGRGARRQRARGLQQRGHYSGHGRLGAGGCCCCWWRYLFGLEVRLWIQSIKVLHHP